MQLYSERNTEMWAQSFLDCESRWIHPLLCFLLFEGQTLQLGKNGKTVVTAVILLCACVCVRVHRKEQTMNDLAKKKKSLLQLRLWDFCVVYSVDVKQMKTRKQKRCACVWFFFIELKQRAQPSGDVTQTSVCPASLNDVWTLAKCRRESCRVV